MIVDGGGERVKCSFFEAENQDPVAFGLALKATRDYGVSKPFWVWSHLKSHLFPEKIH